MKKILLILLTITICSCCPVKQKSSDIQSDVKVRDTENVRILSVAPYRVIGMGVGPRPCYLVKEGKEGAWQMFYAAIKGFDFETGMSYQLKVKESPVDNPPADGSSLAYDLVKVIRKKREIQPLQSLNGHWKVIRLNSTKRIPAEVGQTIEIDMTAMTVTGYGGSNQYRGQLEGTDGSSIIGFKQMISTRRYGPHQSQEDLLFQVQKEVDGFYRYGQSLLLLADQKVVVEARISE